MKNGRLLMTQATTLFVPIALVAVCLRRMIFSFESARSATVRWYQLCLTLPVQEVLVVFGVCLCTGRVK